MPPITMGGSGESRSPHLPCIRGRGGHSVACLVTLLSGLFSFISPSSLQVWGKDRKRKPQPAVLLQVQPCWVWGQEDCRAQCQRGDFGNGIQGKSYAGYEYELVCLIDIPSELADPSSALQGDHSHPAPSTVKVSRFRPKQKNGEDLVGAAICQEESASCPMAVHYPPTTIKNVIPCSDPALVSGRSPSPVCLRQSLT